MSTAPYPDQLKLYCSELGCDRGGTPIVRGVSFELEAGEAIQIFGSNGAGKSTLLSAIAGRGSTAEGEVEWSRDGTDRQRATPRDSLAILDHEGGLKPTLSVSDNLRFWRSLYGKTQDDEDAALEVTGLTPRRNQLAFTLSAGQKRRLSLARLIMSNRPVWLLDEPTASVDAKGVDDIVALLSGHLQRGGLAIIATHHRLALAGQQIRIG